MSELDQKNRRIFRYLEQRRAQGADDVTIVRELCQTGLADSLTEAAAAPRVYDALERIILHQARRSIRHAGQPAK